MRELYWTVYGGVSTDQVAAWYEEHGDRLFDGNIRKALGPTPVNDAMIRTLSEEPEHFWYFNNGVTILAEQLTQAAARGPARDYGRFRLTDATISTGPRRWPAPTRPFRLGMRRLAVRSFWSGRSRSLVARTVSRVR